MPMQTPNSQLREVAVYVDPSSSLTPVRPILRGRLHQLAFVCSVVGLVALVQAASTPRATAVAWIYGLASALLYLTSSTYHIFAKSPRARRILQRADHSMIFVLIAGSFTPIAVLAVPNPWRWPALAAMWAGAAVGVTLKLVAMDRYPKIGSSLYIVLGVSGALIFPTLRDHPDTVLLVALGGALYVGGALMFALRRPRLSPRWFSYHEVWHSLGVAAGILFYVANLGLVRAG